MTMQSQVQNQIFGLRTRVQYSINGLTKDKQ
jgi:hypothetical protein